MTTSFDPILSNLSKTNQLSQTIRYVNDFEATNAFSETISFGCSANITIDQIEFCLKKHSFLNKKMCRLVMGSFDSHIENIELFKKEGVDYLILINFFDALITSFESRIPLLEETFIEDIKIKIKSQMKFILNKSSHFKEIFIPSFHRRTVGHNSLNNDSTEAVLQQFNQLLVEVVKGHSNAHIIDFSKVLENLGRSLALDDRYYFKYSAPYTFLCFDELVKNIFSLIKGGGSYFYKALVVDCDNTLWQGVIGEDLIEGIKLTPHEYPGNIYWTIQNEILALKRQGVLIVLCSKNNPADVDEVLADHPNMRIRDDDIILKKVNWTNKVQNLKDIAAELNIGLDSLVFLDDSEFECRAVEDQLPEVKTVQVPKNIFDYSRAFQEIKKFFASIQQNQIYPDKTGQYKIRSLAHQEATKFSSHEEYLASLNITVVVKKNDIKSIQRISELTQKSNQFNLTTHRYSTSEIGTLFESEGSDLFSLEINDKFGNSGLTGVIIMQYHGETLEIESFLMSCRVIGRSIEFAVWKGLLSHMATRKFKYIQCAFQKTAKNELVASFYDKMGFSLAEVSSSYKKYKTDFNLFVPPNIAHINVEFEF